MADEKEITKKTVKRSKKRPNVKVELDADNHLPLQPSFVLADFPQLGSSELPEHPLNSPWVSAKCDKKPVLKLVDASGAPTPVNCVKDLSESGGLVTDMRKIKQDVEASTKLKRSRRPISLDISEIIVQNTKVKNKTVNQRRQQRERGGEILSGNILDSSKPIRKKGKSRETKKIKLSRLKLLIIKDRFLKNTGEASAIITSLETNQMQCIIEKYLTDRKSKLLTDQKRILPDNAKIPAVTKRTEETSSNKIFSRKFRSYCENVLTTTLDAVVKEFIKSLVLLQDRAFARDPIRARARKRYVVGFREATKYLKLKNVKFLIIAPDLENSSENGALQQCIQDVKDLAAAISIPCVFALNRKKIGFCSLRKVPVSVFAVLSYEGLEALFQTMMEEYQEARKKFIESEFMKNCNEISQLMDHLNIDNTDESYTVSNK